MTISSTISRALHVTNSAVTDYVYPFKIFHAAQLRVTVVDTDTGDRVDLILAQDYGVTGVGSAAGGAVQLTASGKSKAGTGRHLVILRSMEFTQETDYRPHDIFPAETHERALDTLTMMSQELKETLSRTIIRNPDEDESIPYHEIVAVVENMESYKKAAEEAATASAKSADESEGSAEDSARSATAAKTAQTGAETARNQAQTYATNSANSATAAKTSETNSANSATAAKTAQTGAETARNQAQTYATNSANSATAALEAERTITEALAGIDDNFSHVLFSLANQAAQSTATATRHGIEIFNLGGFQ